MKGTRQLRLVLVSDTHELHESLDMPEADLMIFAGDLSFFSKSAAAILDFNNWVAELPYPTVLVPGNHDTFLESGLHGRSLMNNAHVLINESIEVKGLKIWGSPVTPLASSGFAMPSPSARRKLYSSIPMDTDILVTHFPPYGILDRSPGSGDHQGCQEVLAASARVKPKLHVFGHVHGAHGVLNTPDTTFVNASLLGLDGDIDARPIVLRMAARG